MLVIKGVSVDPHFNLASEQYLMDNFDEDIFYLWQNDRSVIIGKNQNTLSEIDPVFVAENGIKVARRLTGGGAVFHDLGNLNYSVIEKATDGAFGNYALFSESVIDYLRSLGLDASLSGRNDILACGKKISGNAQTLRNGRLLHHGTLLYSADLSRLAGALRPRPEKYQSRGIKSVGSRVANVKDLLETDADVGAFAEGLYRSILKREGAREYAFSDADTAAVEKLRLEKFSTWEWNYGEAPRYAFKNGKRTEGGVVEISLSAEGGVIKEIKITGDFFGRKDVSELEKKLMGVRHDPADVRKALAAAPASDYISGASVEELSGLFF